MDYYGQLFCEVIGQMLTSLQTRFSLDTFNFLKQIEMFMTKKENNVDQIVSFYDKDDFDADRLTLHRDMLLDLMNDRIGLKRKSIEEIKFVKNNLELMKLIPEVFKLLRIVLTIPVSNSTCERSFSALKRLKSYLRSTMLAKRLNHISLLHVHQFDINLYPLIDEFILRATRRKNTFSLTKK